MTDRDGPTEPTPPSPTPPDPTSAVTPSDPTSEPAAPTPTEPARPADPTWGDVPWSGSPTASPGSPPGPATVQYPAAPPVGWGPPPAVVPVSLAGEYEGGRPPFTVGALLSDAFARYGADPIRLFLFSAVATVLSYVSSYTSNPFSTTAFVDTTGLLGLLALVIGVVTGSATFALLEGGPDMPFARVMRRGIERAGWMVLTAIILGLGVGLVFLIALIPTVLVMLASPQIAFVLFLLVFLVFAWVIIRLGLALTANVVDNANSIEALKLSWQVTRPTGVWLRILACGFALGLLILPATIGGSLLLFAGMFGQPALVVGAAVLLAIITPLSSTLIYSAYRRLVPPFQPSWTGRSPVVPDATAQPPGVGDLSMPAAETAPTLADTTSGTPTDTDATAPFPSNPESGPGAAEPAIPPLAPLVAWGAPAAPAAPPVTPPGAPAWTAASGAPAGTPGYGAPAARPVFVPPRFGGAAKGLLVALILLGAGGIVGGAWIFGEFASGRVDLPTIPGFPNSSGNPGFPGFPNLPGIDGAVTPGTVAFGTGADLDTCTVSGQTVIVQNGTPIYWVAAFTRRTTPADEVRLRIRLDGTEIVNEVETRGIYDCLGTEQPEVGLTPGIYTFEVLVNGTVDATGTLFAS